MLAPITSRGTTVKLPPSSDVNVSCKEVADPGERRDSPLFLDQTEARGTKKIFFDTGTPLISGPGCLPPPPPAPNLKFWMRHCKVRLFKDQTNQKPGFIPRERMN